MNGGRPDGCRAPATGAGDARLRILWLKIGGLWPLDAGGRLRSFHMLAQLSRRHRVTVLTTHLPGEDPQVLREQLPSCERIVSVAYAPPKRSSARFAAALAGSWFSTLPVDVWKCRVPALAHEAAGLMAARAVDLCVADFLVAVPNVVLSGPVPVVYFAHNVEYLIWKRLRDNERSAWRRALLDIEWRKMRRYEAAACRRASLSVAVSEPDRELLAALAPRAALSAIPTGVDAGYFAPSEIEVTDRLVYVGSMDWHPNEDAVLHFIEAVLPKIRRRRPAVSFAVVGRNPSRRLQRIAHAAGVHVSGTVADVRPLVAEAAVVVVPLRVGGGTRLKIFEALAMGKAVVATRIGAEGLPLVDGVHYVRAEESTAFADAVVALLLDPARRRRLGLAGRRLVEARYSWERVTADFEALLRRAAAGRARANPAHLPEADRMTVDQ